MQAPIAFQITNEKGKQSKCFVKQSGSPPLLVEGKNGKKKIPMLLNWF